MEYALLLLSLIFILAGVVGSVLPALPGIPLSWVGLLCFYLIGSIPFNYWIMGTTLLIALVITVLDYIIPAQGTKRFGGSKYGIWGTNIGLIVGFFVPIPFGFIIGPFIGAMIGELLFDKNLNRSLKAASGSFAGFLASTFMKFVIAICFLGLFIQQVWTYRAVWF